jgi:hypothetical protein
MFLELAASQGMPFAEAGAEYLRGNLEDAKSSAAIDAALSALPVAGVAAKPVARAVKRAMPVTKELLHDAFNAAQEAGLIQGPAYAIRAYHGSPHRFDKLDMSKIGSGEGAQAYGHGLYTAESPKVAEEYQKKLSGDQVLFKGSPLPESTDDALNPKAFMARWALGNKMSGDALIKHWTDLVNESKAAAKEKAPDWQQKISAKQLEQRKQLLREAKKYKPEDYSVMPQGYLYELNLRWPDAARESADPLSPHHFLDWDKPLSEQSSEVKKLLLMDIDSAISQTNKALVNASERRLPTTKANLESLQREQERLLNLKGSDFYNQQSLGTTAGNENSSEYLRTLGIPGIRYKDAASRSTEGGTSNYVIFSDELAEILKRNDEQLKAKGGKVEANAFPYGLRHDSELPKGKGYFGPMTTSSGDVMTEYSSSDDAGDYPLVVPTLTADEIRTLLSNGELTEQMLEKAQGWADARRKMGKSPFAGSDELRLPVPKKAGGSTTKSVKKR